MMKLYACGFNAWNQLRFGGTVVEEPYDLWHFEKVLEDKVIENWRAGFSSTLGKYHEEHLRYQTNSAFSHSRYRFTNTVHVMRTCGTLKRNGH
jgi:hypothetical protein